MRVLLIDDVRNEDLIEFGYGIRPNAVVRTYDSAIAAIQEGNWDIVYLDHDLGESDIAKTGYGIMNFIEANPHLKPGQIHIVSANPVGRKNMQIVIDRLYK